MKKRMILLIAMAIPILIVVSSCGFASQKENRNHEIGRLFQEKQSDGLSSEEILAAYRDEQLSQNVVEYYQEIWSGQLPEGEDLSVRETIDRIMENVILWTEAQDRGIPASEEEVDEKVAIHRQSYAENEWIREGIDAFCEGAGISVDDYFAQLREQSYHSILKAKLTMQIQEELCSRQGIQYEAGNVPPEIQESAQEELARIVAQRMDEVIYITENKEVPMENLGLLVIGVIITVLGCVNLSGNISTIHSYNRRKVRDEDIPKYGMLMGAGSVVIGLAAIAAFFVARFGDEGGIPYLLIPACVVGVGLMLYAQFKYNHGLF